MLKTLRLAMLFLLITFRTAFAASNPYGISDEVDEGLKQGFQLLFNLQFKEAEATLGSLASLKKDQPMVALAEVVRHWWELSIDVMEISPNASQPFLEAADRCLKLSNDAIAAGDSRGSAHLAMGTTLGLMSRWSAANRAWVPAYLRGIKSSNYLEQLLLKNKKASDAYMCLGTFNYARELIRKRSGVPDPDDTGKLSLGLDQLRKAYESGTYFRQASGLMLAGILTNDDPSKAVPLLRELREELPQSAFVHMILVTALYNSGDIDAMEIEANDLLSKAESGDYTPNFKTQGHFAKGLVAFRQKSWKEAAENFSRAVEVGTRRNPYATWAHLYQGYAYDALGQRKKAVEKYNIVLKLPRRYASHDHAKNRLQKPFRPSDPEMKKLEV